MQVDLSIIVPTYNESKNLPILISLLNKTLTRYRALLGIVAWLTEATYCGCQ